MGLVGIVMGLGEVGMVGIEQKLCEQFGIKLDYGYFRSFENFSSF